MAALHVCYVLWETQFIFIEDKTLYGYTTPSF